MRSTNQPACIETSRIGSDDADATRPTRNALFESSNASQPSAIDLHPRADERQRLAEPEKAEVPVALKGLKGIERGGSGHS